MSLTCKVPKLRFGEFNGEWEEKKIKDVAQLVGGGTPETNKEEYWNGDIQWFTPTEIKSDFVSKSIRTISEIGLKKSSAKLLPVGTILLTTRATIGDVAIAINECATNQGFQSLIVDENNINLFVFNWIKNNKNELVKRASGSTFLEISKSKIEQIKINLPSKLEQQKIASFLSAVDTKIDQLTRKKELLEQYKKGVMQKIFSQELRFKADDGSEFPEWVEKKLGEVCKLQSGYAFKSNLFKDEGIPIVRISNISNKNNYIDETRFVYYDELKNDSNFCIKTGDLLLAMSGATTGKSSIYNLKNKAYLNQRVGVFKANQNKLYYDFLIQFVFSKYFSQQLIEVLVAGAQPNVSSKDIELFTIHIPSLPEQTKIANFLSSLDEKCLHVSQQLEATKQFKKALLQQMFV